jgi:hypothetical protein
MSCQRASERANEKGNRKEKEIFFKWKEIIEEILAVFKARHSYDQDDPSFATCVFVQVSSCWCFQAMPSKSSGCYCVAGTRFLWKDFIEGIFGNFQARHPQK